MSHITIQVQLNAAILLILIFIPKSFWSLGKMEKCHYLSCMKKGVNLLNVFLTFIKILLKQYHSISIDFEDLIFQLKMINLVELFLLIR